MNKNVKLPTNRNFGIVFGIIFLLLSFYPAIFNEKINIIFLCFSLCFFVLGILNSSLLTPLNKIWLKFGIILGNIISPLVLGFIYFIIITPIGIIMRLLKTDLLNLKKSNKESYWIKKVNNSDMKDQF
tara:strand:- start:574 stop:957 length:384 start_codon:yes stop_codon:yes gene_type:complete